MQPDADDRLVQRVLAGNAEAFGVLVNRYRGRVVNLAYRMLGDRERADDAAQEAFVRAYRSLHTYRPGGRFGPWLLSVTAHRCIDLLRRRPFASASLDDEGLPEAPDQSPDGDPPRAYSRAEVERRVHQALGKLPDAQRLAVALVHLQGLSYEAAAEVLGQPVGTVKSYAHRARMRLKVLLSSYVEESMP